MHLVDRSAGASRLCQIYRDLIAPALRADQAAASATTRLIHVPAARLALLGPPLRDLSKLQVYCYNQRLSLVALGDGDEVMSEHLVTLVTAASIHADLSWCLDRQGGLWLVSDDDAPDPVWVSLRSRGLYFLGAPPFEPDEMADGLSRAASIIRRAVERAF